MPFGSELVCWPDSLSTGAQPLRGGLGSEMGAAGAEGAAVEKYELFWLKSLWGKNHSCSLMADPPLPQTLSLLPLLFLAAFIFQKQVESSSL